MKRKQITPPPGYVTVADAAKMIDRAPMTIYRHIDAGRLSAIRLGRMYFVSLSDIQAMNGLTEKQSKPRDPYEPRITYGAFMDYAEEAWVKGSSRDREALFEMMRLRVEAANEQRNEGAA